MIQAPSGVLFRQPIHPIPPTRLRHIHPRAKIYPPQSVISLQLLPAVLVQVVGRGGVCPRAVEGEAEGLDLILRGVAEFHGFGEFGASINIRYFYNN
ncbi:MAG: hypothetical protein R3C61_08285 [Bacteroidia bacterium]